MHIPWQGFGRVRTKIDRDSRIRFADLQGRFFKGESQKGTAENCNCKPSISVRFVCISLFALRGARFFFKPFSLRHIGGYGHKMLRESRGDHRRLSSLTIFFHLRVILTGIASGTVQHTTLCVSFRVQPKTTYKFYTSFKYYGREKIRV